MIPRRRSRGALPLRGRRAAAGVVLVESIVVLAILGLVLALAFSGRSLIDNRRLAGAARDLGTTVRGVEQRARAERRCWRVVFDAATETYTTQYLAGGMWTPTGGCSGGAWTDSGAPRALPAGVDLLPTTFGGNVMTVSPFGNPNAGTAVLRSPGGAQRRVTVNVGGRVTITP